MSARESWATRLGFILAAVGSAVGLGNIWQFPFKTATNGGAAFLIVYLVAVALIGLPAILAEFVIGRRTNLNVIDAFEDLGHRYWRIVGAFILLTGVWILSYYTVVGGWVLRYLAGSFTGGYFADPGGYFVAISAGPDAVAFNALFLGITVLIVARGVRGGIERATKILMPALALFLIALAIYAGTLPGAGAGYSYFLSPDMNELWTNLGSIIPFAVGQAVFTLSLGMGIMITYSSYIASEENIVVDGATIVVANTSIGVLAGLVVFPLLFAQGIDPETSGAGAVFISIASAFGDLPAGKLLGFIFFGSVFFAALTSAISLLEVSVSYAIDNYDFTRVRATMGTGMVLFTLGLPSALDTAWLGWFDGLAFGILLPIAVLGTLVFVGWVIAGDALTELSAGTSGLTTIGPTWLWTVRVVVIVAVSATIILGAIELADTGGIIPPI